MLSWQHCLPGWLAISSDAISQCVHSSLILSGSCMVCHRHGIQLPAVCRVFTTAESSPPQCFCLPSIFQAIKQAAIRHLLGAWLPFDDDDQPDHEHSWAPVTLFHLTRPATISARGHGRAHVPSQSLINHGRYSADMANSTVWVIRTHSLDRSKGLLEEICIELLKASSCQRL